MSAEFTADEEYPGVERDAHETDGHWLEETRPVEFDDEDGYERERS